ncbi:MAG: hypothetical protein RDU59_06755 [Thermodesulfobacteriota bacterium]|nr:hypothetical protein [Thermodesulfobacteriota bacterium]
MDKDKGYLQEFLVNVWQKTEYDSRGFRRVAKPAPPAEVLKKVEEWLGKSK